MHGERVKIRTMTRKTTLCHRRAQEEALSLQRRLSGLSADTKTSSANNVREKRGVSWKLLRGMRAEMSIAIGWRTTMRNCTTQSSLSRRCTALIYCVCSDCRLMRLPPRGGDACTRSCLTANTDRR